MATIKINLDVKSINKAIKQVEEIQRKLKEQVPSLFIDKALTWIKDRANFYLSTLPMDSEITGDIQESWTIERVTNNLKRLVNSSRKAVFVEFGVGIVGQQQEHPQATKENYEYNIPTRYKHSDGKWVFSAKHKQYAIDLNEGYFQLLERENSGKIVAITKGSPANLYLYNAGMDLLNTGAYQQLWVETLNELL